MRRGNVTVGGKLEDHREVESLFQELETGGATPERRQQLVSVVVAELVRHSVAEEQHLYPAARVALDDGDELADHEIDEHAEAEATMKRLEGLEPTDAQRRKKMSPTRPHPRSPDESPANKLLAPGTGLVDRVRDAVSNRATKPADL